MLNVKDFFLVFIIDPPRCQWPLRSIKPFSPSIIISTAIQFRPSLSWPGLEAWLGVLQHVNVTLVVKDLV